MPSSRVFLLASLALSACQPPHEEGHDADTGEDVLADDSPEFVVTSTLFGDDATNSYVTFLETLEGGELGLETAREYAGWTTTAALDGMVFVGEGEAPTLRRYGFDAEGALVEDGELSFLNYGLASAPLYQNVMVSPTKAYMSIDTRNRVIWDPAALEITGELEVAEVPAERDGYTLRAAYDRGMAVRDGLLFAAHYWSDDAYYGFSPTSTIAVIDVATDTVLKTLDAPCPMLDTVSTDEEGNLYFANSPHTVAALLLEDDAPANCVVKIPAGSTEIDATWTKDLSGLTGGRQYASFRYVADGVGILSAFHAEEVPAESAQDPYQMYLPHWRVWRVDLEGGTATPMEDAGWLAGGFYAFRVEGRTVLLLPDAAYAATTAWEVAADGALTYLFDVPGWSYQLSDLK